MTSRSSFYWAMRLLPRERRRAMFSLYAYCRMLDDVADGELGSVEQRRQCLAAAQASVMTWPAARAEEQEGEFAALVPAIRRFGLPLEELDALILGMSMDVEGPLIAPPWETLRLYCRRVAGAVGVLALHIFGRPDAYTLALLLGEALQLTNILRDRAEDAALGRLYLPEEALVHAGIPSRIPAEVLQDPRVAVACAEVAARAEACFQAAEEEIKRLGRSRLWPAIAMMRIYRRQLGRPSSRGGVMPLWITLRALVER